MQTVGLLVIGSGPAGIAAARAYEQAGGEGEVLVVTADAHPPYERPPLSKHSLRGEAPTLVPLADAEGLRAEIRCGTRVSALDPATRTVWMGEQTIHYDRVVLAPGTSPIALDAPEDADLYPLRSYADLERLHAAATHARTAVVVGAGFIGCEVATSLAMRGLEVTLVSPEAAPQVERLGERVGDLIADLLVGQGVSLRLGVSVTGVEAPRTLHLSDGGTLAPDLVVTAVGVHPATEWLVGSGVSLHEGHVVATEHLEVGPAIWAAGDAVRAHHAVAGRPVLVEHWGDAVTMGEIAGSNAASPQSRTWREVPGFWSTIGTHTLKYSAWGDGYDTVEVDERPGRMTVWYGKDDEVVGVLTYDADDDYERGSALVGERAAFVDAVAGAQPEER